MIQSIKSHYPRHCCRPRSIRSVMTNSHIIAQHTCGMNAFTTITRGGGGVVPDSARCNGVGHWFFIPCLGEGQQKTVSTETNFAGPPHPVLYDQSFRPLGIFSVSVN